MTNRAILIVLSLFLCGGISAQLTESQQGLANRNKPEREQWLMDNGFGIFIHWSLDSQLGIVISHSLAGASQDYIERYVNDLPTTFNPSHWDPYQLGLMFKRAGAKYVVFTTKHHSGFCMWDTKSTDFNIMKTPYGKDVVRSYVDGMRNAGLAVGYYYSPEDFIFSWRHGVKNINRNFKKEDYAPFKAEFKKYVETQITELFSNYGPIDMFFNDGEIYGFANPVVWDLQPNCLITRSAIPTPEQAVPSIGIAGAWESNLTMTDQWQYKPNDVNRKSPMRMIEALVETRAKGGALLLNIGPRPDGLLDDADYKNLVTLSAWNFINSEAIFNTRPWVVTNEEQIWFTKNKDENTIYVFLFGEENWRRGERREFTLNSIKISEKTRVSVLGMSGEIVEYNPHLRGKAYPTATQTNEGLNLSVMRAQRIYNNHEWPYPLVVKLENVEPALSPPQIKTEKAIKSANRVVLRGTLLDIGDANAVEIGFEYRAYEGWIPESQTSPFDKDWQKTPLLQLSKPGDIEMTIELEATEQQIYRAVLHHPKITLYGGDVQL